MRSHAFAFFNLIGAVGWVGLCLGAGLLFGNVPIVKENFSLVTIGTKRPRMTALPPYCSKNAWARFR